MPSRHPSPSTSSSACSRASRPRSPRPSATRARSRRTTSCSPRRHPTGGPWSRRRATRWAPSSRGGSATAEFVFEVTDAAAADLQTVRVDAAYTSQREPQTVSGANQLYVAYGSLAGAFNAVAVTEIATATAGNFDGGGATFSAEALARAGVTPGSSVTVGAGDAAIEYHWPEPIGAAELGLARRADDRAERPGHAPCAAGVCGLGRWGEPRARAELHRRHDVEAERVLPELAAAGVGARRCERGDHLARAQQRDQSRRVRVPDGQVPGLLEPRAAEPGEGARVRRAADRVHA